MAKAIIPRYSAGYRVLTKDEALERNKRKYPSEYEYMTEQTYTPDLSGVMVPDQIVDAIYKEGKCEVDAVFDNQIVIRNINRVVLLLEDITTRPFSPLKKRFPRLRSPQIHNTVIARFYTKDRTVKVKQI